MIPNYHSYLGSETKRNYEECVHHVQAEANYLEEKGYWDLYDYDFKKNKTIKNISGKSQLCSRLERIQNASGTHPLNCADGIGTYYEARASIHLLKDANVIAFKQDAYVGAKLKILGTHEILGWVHGVNTSCFFLPIMSDSPDLIRLLIKHKDYWKGKYERTDPYSFFLRNTLLALAGDWDILKERSELFLNDPKKQKRDEKRIPDHEFYLGLCNQSIEEMETALNKLLEPKLAKKAVYDNNVWFDFYLQMQVLMYAKIAAIHGFDLNIDSPIAPKELIEYKPLEKYEDPYDFMKEFDYDKPIEDWINMWQERMRIAKEQEAKKKKGFFSWLRK